MAEVPQWHLKGDWFDVCSCRIPCPCTFAQPPSDGFCDGVWVCHIRDGQYGDLRLDDLTFLRVGHFEGNLWTGDARGTAGVFISEQADERQRTALRTIFSGQAGGFPEVLATLFPNRTILGIEFVPIQFEVADDLAYWRVEIPGKVAGRGEPLTGPTNTPGKWPQLFNAPGAEMGPDTVSTWGRATANRVEAYGFTWEWVGKSSKHMPFDWAGPD